MLRPEKLMPQDEIRVLTTARKVDIVELQEAKDWLIGLGYQVSLGHTISLSENQYGGSDAERAEDFQQALNDKQVKAIWFARGGYGSIRIMDKIDWNSFIAHPKWLIGFSDITIWHNLVNQFYGIQTLHAIMPMTFPKDSEGSKALLAENLCGQFPEITFGIHPLNARVQGFEGEIIGGNLSILYSLLGTKAGFNTNGKILFIEEIDEYLYHIDRMMIALKYSGKLSGIKGLIVGGFTDIKDNQTPFGKCYEEIILEHTSDYSYPIIFGFPAGHIDDNRPIVLGASVKLEITDIVKMEYQ